MTTALLDKMFGSESSPWSAQIARLSVLFYAFVLPFTHNAALKNLALAGMIVALIAAARERRLCLDLRSPVLLSIVAVMALTLLSSIAGIEVLGNLNDYRKHFLPLVLAVPLVIIHFRKRESLLVLLGTLSLAFSIRAALALVEMLTMTREEGLFFKGFAIESALYAPLVAGLVIATRGHWRAWWSAVLLLVAVAVLINGSRTAALAVALGCVAIPVLLGRWRQFLAILVVGGVVGAAVMAAKPDLVSRYEEAIQASSYSGPRAMAIRYPIWMGVWEIAKQRPVLGHGFGWKKLGATAAQEGFLDRWKASSDPYLAYTVYWFSLPTAKVNPHSLVMQLLFETGFAGLIAYLAMMVMLFWQAFKLARSAPPEWRPFAATVFGFLTGYLVINISNGLWIGAGPTIFTIAMLEICRQQHETPR